MLGRKEHAVTFGHIYIPYLYADTMNIHTEVDEYGKGRGSGRSYAAALPLQPYMKTKMGKWESSRDSGCSIYDKAWKVAGNGKVL